MSFFSASYKYYQSVSFQPLREKAFGEYSMARKQIGFATAPARSMYGMEMWKYKHNYRKTFNSNLVKKLGAEPMELSIKNLDYSRIRDYLYNEAGLDDYQAIIGVFDKNTSVLGEINDDPSDSEVIEELLGRDSIVKHRNHDDTEDYWFYSDNEDGLKLDGTTRYKILSETISDDMKVATLSYTDLTYRENDDGEIVESNNGDNSIDFECSEFFYARVIYLDTNGEMNTDDAYIPYEYFTDSISTEETKGDVSFSPMFQLKGDNEPVDVKRDQDRMLRQFGVDLSSVQNMIDNEDIDDFRISIAFAPEDATRSSAVAKYMFNFFDSIEPEETEPRAITGEEFNNSVHFELDTLDVDMRFSIYKETKSGTIPRGEDVSDMKVKLRQVINNQDRYYDDVKEVYDECIGGSSAGIVEMYKEVEDNYFNDRDNSDAEKCYNKLPPTDYRKTSMLTKEVYAFCDPSDLETVLYDEMHINVADEDDDPNWVRFWEIESYKKTRTIKKSESELYYVEISLADTMNIDSNEDIYPPTTKESQMVHMNLYKQISADSYDVIYYRGGKLEYAVDGHTAKVYHERPDGTFRIFMTDGYLDKLSFKEYTALYDRGICGIAYCQERVKVRWYQKAGFALFVQLVMVAITIVTAGAGSVLTVVVNMAINIAVAYAAMKIAEMIGGEAGVIIGTIVAVAAFVFTGQLDSSSMAKLWMSTSDMYMKLELKHLQDDAKKMQDSYNEFKKEIEYRTNLLKEQMSAYEDNGYTKETIIKNIANKAYNDGYTDIRFDVEVVEEMQDNEWKLQEVPEPEYDPVAKLYRETSIPRDIVEFEDKMMVQTTFGPI